MLNVKKIVISFLLVFSSFVSCLSLSPLAHAKTTNNNTQTITVKINIEKTTDDNTEPNSSIQDPTNNTAKIVGGGVLTCHPQNGFGISGCAITLGSVGYQFSYYTLTLHIWKLNSNGTKKQVDTESLAGNAGGRSTISETFAKMPILVVSGAGKYQASVTGTIQSGSDTPLIVSSIWSPTFSIK